MIGQNDIFRAPAPAQAAAKGEPTTEARASGEQRRVAPGAAEDAPEDAAAFSALIASSDADEAVPPAPLQGGARKSGGNRSVASPVDMNLPIKTEPTTADDMPATALGAVSSDVDPATLSQDGAPLTTATADTPAAPTDDASEPALDAIVADAAPMLAAIAGGASPAAANPEPKMASKPAANMASSGTNIETRDIQPSVRPFVAGDEPGKAGDIALQKTISFGPGANDGAGAEADIKAAFQISPKSSPEAASDAKSPQPAPAPAVDIASGRAVVDMAAQPDSLTPGSPLREGAAAPGQTAPAAPPPGAEARQMAQIATQISSASRAGDDRVEIRLDPPELGRVRLSFTFNDDGVSALVSADRPEVVDLMRRHGEALQRELTAAGYRNVTLDFGPSDQRGDQESDGGNGERGRSARAEDGAATQTLWRAVVPRDRLDIRL